MNDRFVEDLKTRTDLVEIIRKYAEVKKSGKNFMCRSPFRNERTPSFSISPEKQMWYDFGASEGGDAISFIEKIENVSFQEALEVLADIAGIEVPKSETSKNHTTTKTKKDIYQLHDKATEFFAIQLQKNKKASDYAKGRGITQAMITDWRLGYGGDDKKGLSQFLLKAGFSETLIQQSGVSFERSFGDKSMMDRFWGRLMIPICEPRRGEIIAFSARDILDREKVGKYINSPENPVYHKSSTLFGLDKARQSIRKNDKVLLVEGNLDVVFAHACGFDYTVATCGTALTEEHLWILKRLTKNLYLAFDNDMAGKKATLKSVEMCLGMELNPFVVQLEGVKDLGELLMDSEKATVLQKAVDNCPSALDFFLERFASKNLKGSIEGEKNFLDHFFFFLKLVTRPIEIDDYLNKVTAKVKRPKAIVEAEFDKYKGEKSNYTKPKYTEEKIIRFTREEHFVGFIASNWVHFKPGIVPKKEKLLALFVEDETRNILSKKIEETDFLPEESQKILAWEMWQDQLHEGGAHKDTLNTDFQTFIGLLEKEKAKKERIATAKALKF